MTSKKSKPSNKKNSTPGSAPPAFQEIDLLDLKRYVQVVRERWITGMACALLVTALLGYFLINKPPVYESSSKLLIERKAERVLDIQQVVDTSLEGGGQQTEILLQTHVEQLRTRSFLDRVIESLTEAEKRAILAPYTDPENPSELSPEHRLERLISRNRTIERVGRNTLLVDIFFRHRAPEIATLLANRYAEQYIHYLLDHSSGSNDSALIFLNQQAEELRGDVEAADLELQQYRQRHNMVSLEENQNIIGQRLAALEDLLTRARAQRLEVDLIIDQIDEYQENGENLLEIEQISRYGSIPTLLVDLDELESRRAVLDQRYLSRHPQMIENTREIEKLEELIARNIQNAISEIRTRHRSAIRNEEQRRAELVAAEQDAFKMDELGVEYNVLRRELDGKRSTYAQVLSRLNETRLSSQLDNTNINIADRGDVPLDPTEPNLKKIALLLMFLGGTLFIGVPIGLETLDNKLKSSSDVETLLKQNLLAEIPTVKKVAEKDRGHVVKRQDQGPSAESFRGLYGQLHILSELDPPKIMLVTSTVPGEGKSFVASNLAWSYANNEHKVLLVDCDFRRPTVHRTFDIENKQGVLTWLETEAGAAGIPGPALGIHQVDDHLSILCSGGRSNRAPEIFGSTRFHDLMNELKKEYDTIIFDTPPLAVFPDALTLSQIADETIYISRFDKVNRHMIKGILDRLEQTPSDLMGIVLNDMPHTRTAAYHYSGYGYYGHKKYKKYYEHAS